MAFQDAIYYLDSIGLTDVILPFVLIFTILFALLERIKIFGEGSRKYHMVIALAIAAGVVIPHVTGAYGNLGYDPIEVLKEVLPGSALIIVVVVTVLIVLGVVMNSNQLSIGGSPLVSGVAFLAILALIGVVGRALFPWLLPYEWLSWLDSPDTQAAIVMIAVFGLIVWYLTGEPKKPTDPSGMKKFHEFMKDFTGSKGGP